MLVPADVVPSLVGVVVLTAIATVVLVLFRVPASWTPALAIARAYKLGRIQPAELHDFRAWLARNARPGTVRANVAAVLEEDHAPIIN